MESKRFEKWLTIIEQKSEQVSYNYSKAINRITNHYCTKTGEVIDLYTEIDISKLKKIEELYKTNNVYADFGNYGNGTNKAAFSALLRYKQNPVDDNELFEFEETLESEITEQNLIVSNNFSYEKDLKNSLLYQIEEFFPKYKIFGNNSEGVEFLIANKRIDILLEKENELLIIELKAGIADYKVFGQISMYLSLIRSRFPEKTVKGCIIAHEIDQTLKYAIETNINISAKTYNMSLTINEV